jgi:carboxyl-terminal processing protease
MQRIFLRRVAFWCVVTLALIFCPASLAQGNDSAHMSLKERAYIASRVYASLMYFAHGQDLQPADIDLAYKSYLDKAFASDGRFGFSRATSEFLATLHNSHTTLWDMQLMQSGGKLPFLAVYIDGKWIVTQTRVAGLQPGEAIETIDGQSFEQFFQDRRRFISASTEQWARRALFAELPDFVPDSYLFPERFELGLTDGRKIAVDRSTAAPKPAFLTEGRWLEPGKIAYIRIPSFFHPEFEKRALELAREYRGAALLIIDVRGNMGGSTPSDLTTFLMDRPYHWWSESTPVIMPFFRFRASQGQWEYQPFARPDMVWPGVLQQPAQDHFTGKLVLLVDEACHSSCEDFAMPFKDSGRALLYGHSTAGSSGQPYILEFGNGMMLMIGAKREIFPDGTRFEGLGIKPDVEVACTVLDIRHGRDAALEAARKSLAASASIVPAN